MWVCFGVFVVVFFLRLFSRQEEINGVDFDWEELWETTNIRNYIKLLQEAAPVLQSANILTSVSLHPEQTLLANRIHRFVDRVHVMAYDHISQRGTHHASLGYLKTSVQGFLDAGCPPVKLVVGIPAYARNGEDARNIRTFADLLDSMDPSIMLDHLSMMDSWAGHGIWKGYFFDSPTSVRAKLEYVVQQGLAGIFFWELGLDKHHPVIAPGGILLEAIGKTLQELVKERNSPKNHAEANLPPRAENEL